MIQIKNDFSINNIHTDIFNFYAYIFNLIPSSNGFNVNLKLEDILNFEFE